MSSYLTNKAHILISAGSTPSPAEIAAQFAPQSLKVGYESLATEDSGRSDDGVMHITWVLDRVRKLEIGLKPDTPANISAIFNNVIGKKYWIYF